MDKLKYIKFEESQGQYTNSIPIGVDSKNVDLKTGYNLEETIGDYDLSQGTIEQRFKKFKLDKTLTQKDLAAQAEAVGLKLNQKIQIYNTIADVIENKNNLSLYTTIQTLGYYYINDGGGGLYTITKEKKDNSLKIEDGIYAMAIENENINALQYGLKGNDETLTTEKNNSNILKSLITYAKENNKKIQIPNDRKYNFSNYIITDDSIVNYSGINEKLIISKTINQQFRRTRWATVNFSTILGETDDETYSLQGCTFIKEKNQFVFCFANAKDEDSGLLVIGDSGLSSFQRKKFAFGHANGITYNPNNGYIYIACGETGINANKVMVISLNTLNVISLLDFGLPNIAKSGITYDEIHHIYYVLAGSIYIVDNNMNILSTVGSYDKMRNYINPNTNYNPQTIGCIDGILYFVSNMQNTALNEFTSTCLNTYNFETKELKQFWTYRPESFAEQVESIADRNNNYFISFGAENSLMTPIRRIHISIFGKKDSTNDAVNPEAYPVQGRAYTLNNVSYTTLSITRQFRICMLNMTGRTTNIVPQYGGIAMLPAHFRPTEQIYFKDNKGNDFSIKTDGTVQTFVELSEGYGFSATVMFITAM